VSDPRGPDLDPRWTDNTSAKVTDEGGAMNFAPMVLEEEAMAAGWSRVASPTGGKNKPRDTYTVGMRGEPGWDDDVRLGTKDVSRIHGDGMEHD
jgi:hypothetical protein